MGGGDDVGSPYLLSFTAGGLFIREAPVVAEVYLRLAQGNDGGSACSPPHAATAVTWSAVRAEVERDNLLQTRTVSSGKRLAREAVNRLAELSDAELTLLIDATATERGHLMWVAACRQYALVGEFAQEVLRERFLLMHPTVTHDDFDDFFAAKALWHPELADLKRSTVEKIRATLFRMMRESGLITPDGTLVRVVLSHRVAEILALRTPSDIRFFPTVDGVRGG